MKSDFCYIVDGIVVAARLDKMERTVEQLETGQLWMEYIPVPALLELLEPLAQLRTQLEQQRLDARNSLYDAVDSGDASAKKMAAFVKRSTTRIVEPLPAQNIKVMPYELFNKAITACKHCGCDMIRIGFRHRYRHCSNTCAEASAEERAEVRGKYDYYTPRTPTPMSCAHCGNTFAPKRKDARYCSNRCRVAAHRQT